MAVNAEQLLYRSPGGIGRYTAQLITVVPARNPDLEVVPVCARHPAGQIDQVLVAVGADAATRGRVARQALPGPLLNQAWVRWGRPAIRGAGACSVVHAPSVAVPPRSAAALVVSVHDAAPALFPGAFTPRGLRFHRDGWAAAAERADVVLTGTQAAAEEIVGHTPVPAARIRVIPYGIDPKPPAPAVVDRVLAERGLLGRRFVLWVGSLEPRKGVDTLVGAMARLRRRGRAGDVLTVLAGFDGWLNSGLLHEEDLAVLGDDLLRLGRVTEEELWALYSACAAFALPSRHEGFGLPPLEAMSCGAAVVASDLPAVREVLGDAALLVTPGDVEAWVEVLDGVLEDGSVRERLGVAGRARSALFGVDAMAAATGALYREIGS